MIKPCGNFRDITGFRNGRLVAVKPVKRNHEGRIIWECLCDCGTKKLVQSNNMVRLQGTKSCGCLRREVSARKKSWNIGKTYAINNGERIYRQRHSWAKAVIRKNGNKCQKCGWDKARCDAHHIVPKNQGGVNALENGIVLCPNCHRMVHEIH